MPPHFLPVPAKTKPCTAQKIRYEHPGSLVCNNAPASPLDVQTLKTLDTRKLAHPLTWWTRRSQHNNMLLIAIMHGLHERNRMHDASTMQGRVVPIKKRPSNGVATQSSFFIMLYSSRTIVTFSPCCVNSSL